MHVRTYFSLSERGSLFLSYFPYFEKIKVVYPPIYFWMPGPIFMKIGMYIMAPEPISVAYFIHPSHLSVCLYLYAPIVARQRLGKNVTAAKNTRNSRGIVGRVVFMRSVSYQRKEDISSSQNFLFNFNVIASLYRHKEP
jgi:hypothetical protein